MSLTMPDWQRLALRVLIAWTLVAIGTYLVARPLSQLMLPAVEVMIGLMQPDFFADLKIADVDGDPMIVMKGLVRTPIVLSPTRTLAAGTAFDGGSTHVVHAMVPIAILLTVLIAWPIRSAGEFRQRLWRGLLAALPVVALTTPALLVGRVYLLFEETSRSIGGQYGESMLINLFLFMESGGRWLLPLLLGVACVLPWRAAPR